MSQAMPTAPLPPAKDSLGDPALRRSLVEFVRRRVPSSDVDDVVQTVLLDALAAAGRPADPVELRRWLLGVARHKVADLHRRAHREPPAELPDIEDSPPPLEARGLARWAELQAGPEGDAQRTLAWMAREGEGEKLEAIAADEKLPAARVRQRVSRMRRWMKQRWAAELAAVALITTVALAAWWLLRRAVEPPEAHHSPELMPTIAPEPPAPLERARALRADAFRACDRSEWRPCLDGLEQARALDPTGDQEPSVGAARASAEAGLRNAPLQAPDTSMMKGNPLPSEKSVSPKQGPSKVSPKKPSSEVYETSPPPSKPSATPNQGTLGTGTLGTGNGTGTGTGSTPAPQKAMKTVLDSPGFGVKK